MNFSNFSNWTELLEVFIIAPIRAHFSDREDINITTEEKQESDATFPTIYVHLLAPVERGADLTGTTINAVLATVQVDVTTQSDQAKTDAISLAYEVVGVLKGMAFQFPMLPECTQQTQDIAKATMRARRLIGNGNSL